MSAIQTQISILASILSPHYLENRPFYPFHTGKTAARARDRRYSFQPLNLRLIRPRGALGAILVRERIAEQRHQPVAEFFGDVAAHPHPRRRGSIEIGTDKIAPFLGIELPEAIAKALAERTGATRHVSSMPPCGPATSRGGRGVSKSQLYHYFADKDALVLEVIARQTERVLDAQRPHLEAMDSLSALNAWRDAIVRLNKAAQGKGCPLGSLASELANDSEPA